MRAGLSRILLPARNAETLTWRSAVMTAGGSVSNTRLLRVDKLVSSLKGAGVWAKLDRLWLFRADNSQSALRDVVSASAATAVSSPTFTANDGYKSDGSSSYLDLGYAYGAPGKLTQDSAHIGGFCSGSGTNLVILGRTDANGRYSLFAVAAGNDSARLSNNAAVTAANATIPGHHVAVRRDSSNGELYLNGVSLGTTSQASTDVGSGNAHSLESAATFAPNTFTVHAVHSGAQLSAAEIAGFNTAMQTYMAS